MGKDPHVNLQRMPSYGNTPPVPETGCHLCFRTMPASALKTIKGVVQCCKDRLTRRDHRGCCEDTRGSTKVTCVKCKRSEVLLRDTNWNSLNRFERAKAGGIVGKKYYCTGRNTCYHHELMNERMNERRRRNGNQL